MSKDRETSRIFISPEVQVHPSADGVFSIVPTRRDVAFDLPHDRVMDWFDHCHPATHLFTTISIMIPPLERFIIQVIREHQRSVDHPVLSEQLKGLVSQEAIHSREHRDYNDALKASGLPVEKFERLWESMLRRTFATWVPPWFRLAVVLMVEHHAAACASNQLRYKHFFQDAEPNYKLIWMWHSYEEIEHKSVSFDLWLNTVQPGWRGYIGRTGGWLIASTPFWIGFWTTLICVLWSDRRAENSIADYWRLWKLMFGPRGIIVSNAWRWLRFFIPGHHPWQEDNSVELQIAMREVVSEYLSNRRTA